MIRYDNSENWFGIWVEDRKAMQETMVRNMTADLNVGYDYFGTSIVCQRFLIDEYKRQTDAQLDRFKTMREEEINRWCFYDLVQKGAIE